MNELLHVIACFRGERRPQSWLAPDSPIYESRRAAFRVPDEIDYEWLFRRIDKAIGEYRVPMDIIRVWQGEPGRTKTVKDIKEGTLTDVGRENIGISYGAFIDAFRAYQRDYRFFLFMEDDSYLLVRGDMNLWIPAALRILQEKPEVGMVHPWRVDRGIRLHAPGGFGIARGTSLAKVDEKKLWGGINTSDLSYETNKEREIQFSQAIVKAGYDLMRYPL